MEMKLRSKKRGPDLNDPTSSDSGIYEQTPNIRGRGFKLRNILSKRALTVRGRKRGPKPRTPSYFEAAIPEFQIAIYPKCFPHCKLEGQHLRQISEMLVSLIEAEPKDYKPTFSKNIELIEGVILLTCTEVNTKNWVYKIKSRLQILEDKVILVGQFEEVMSAIHVVTELQFPFNKKPTKEILKLLTTQNEGLNVTNWRVIGTRVSKNDIQIMFALNEDDVDILRKHEMNLPFAHGVANFEIFKSKYLFGFEHEKEIDYLNSTEQRTILGDPMGSVSNFLENCEDFPTTLNW